MGCAASDAAASFGNRGLFDSYTVGETLACGPTGQVRSAVCKRSGEMVAVKLSPIQRRNSKREAQDASSAASGELDCWRRAGIHAHIGQLLDAYVEGRVCIFVMSLCEMSLLSYLASRGPLYDEHCLASCMGQLLCALEHVHSLDMIHRDVQLESCLMLEDRLQLCDFSSCVRIEHGEVLQGKVGSPIIMAPEMLQERPYGAKVDTWAVGVLTYMLLYGAHPYAISPDMASVAEGNPLPDFSHSEQLKHHSRVSSSAEALLRRLLERTRSKRASAVAARNSSFIQGGEPKRTRSLQPQLELVRQLQGLDADELTRSEVDKAIKSLERKQRLG